MPDEPTEKHGWDRWAEGTGCPMCQPRPESNEYWDFVARLNISSLYLSKNQTYRGHSLLILDVRHATRPDHISFDEWAMFCADLYAAENALMQTLQPDHINVEIMGNVIPHLHWQIVPRYRSDPRWGAPVWTTTRDEMTVTALPKTAQIELIRKVRNATNKAAQHD